MRFSKSQIHRILIGPLILLWLGCGANETRLEQIHHPDLKGLEAEALASVKASQKKLEEALDGQSQADEKATAYAELGILYFAFSFHDSARTCFENAGKLAPGDYRWIYYLGRLPAKNQSTNKETLERVLELEPGHVPSKIALGQILKTQGMAAEARRLFEEAVATDPSQPVAHYELGLFALADKQFQEAIDHFDQTLKGAPSASVVHYQKALALRQLGQIEAAETQMSLRGDRPPRLTDPLMDLVTRKNALAQYRLAEALRLNGKNADATVHYDRAIDLLPDKIGPRVGRVLNLVQIGEDSQAMIRLRDDIKHFPNNSVLLHILARLLAASANDQVRDGQKSLQLLHILGKGPVTPEMVETLAMAFAETGDFPKAIEFQERALSVTDDSDPAYLVRLQANLDKYRNGQPCRQPWPPQDPIFRLNTYAAMQLPANQPNEENLQ